MLKKQMLCTILAVGFVATSGTMVSAHSTMPQSIAKKTVNWSNAAKASFLGGASVAGVWFYYNTIIEPYIVRLAKRTSLAQAIQFNKQFVLNNPTLAFYFASPLLLSAGCAWIARDYVKKIWEGQELENEQELEVGQEK